MNEKLKEHWKKFEAQLLKRNVSTGTIESIRIGYFTGALASAEIVSLVG